MHAAIKVVLRPATETSLNAVLTSTVVSGRFGLFASVFRFSAVVLLSMLHRRTQTST